MNNRLRQKVEVGVFDRLALQAINIENELVVRQGQSESLTIEAPPEVFDKLRTESRDGQLTIQMGQGCLGKIGAAFATSLTRPHVKYVVTTSRLTDLDIACLADVSVDKIETDRLHVRIGGPGTLKIADISAKRLDIEVTMPSPCRIEVSGQASEQHVLLNAMSDYSARGLVSDRTSVALKGAGGHAVVGAETELDVIIRGMGVVEYFGPARVTKKVSPMGVVKRIEPVKVLGDRRGG